MMASIKINPYFIKFDYAFEIAEQGFDGFREMRLVDKSV